MDSPHPSSRFLDLLRLSSARADRTADPALLRCLEDFHREISRSPAKDEGVGVALDRLLAQLLLVDREHQVLVRDFVLTENDWEMDWSYLREELEDVLFQLATHLPFHEHLNGETHQFVESAQERLRSLFPVR